VERQLAAMFSPQVTLKSGGYIVINQTEALVSVDVNSGKATREHNIEDTALKTNLEASDEIARQLRLRDLAGLIVIDFIDMDERRNNRHVEKRLKEALRNDRARIQVGRISHFGLMEMSRQRLRTGVLEGSTHACVMCQGTGIVRSVESVALDILRSIEDRLITDGVMPLAATTAVEVALYILNQKRGHLKDIEARYQVPVTVTADKELHVSQFVIERAADGTYVNGESAVVQMDWAHHRENAPAPAAEPDREQDKRRSRRRRGRGRGRGEGDERPPAAAAKDAEDGDEDTAVGAAPQETDADGETQPRKSRRRGRRGGRRGRGRGAQAASAEQQGDTGPEDSEAMSAPEEAASDDDRPAPREERPNGSGKSRDRETRPHGEDDSAGEEDGPSRREPEPAFSVAAAREEPVPQAEAHVESDGNDEPAPRRRGWWSRG
jgi:ribonuclease E